MNLIEEFGGYDQAKSERDKINYKLNNGDFVGGGSPKEYLYERLSLIEIDLLEYRRANNIFEVGDKVVYPNLSHKNLFSVRYVNNGEIVVYELWDEMGAKTFTEFYPFSDIRHATDEEIKAGYRL